MFLQSPKTWVCLRFLYFHIDITAFMWKKAVLLFDAIKPYKLYLLELYFYFLTAARIRRRSLAQDVGTFVRENLFSWLCVSLQNEWTHRACLTCSPFTSYAEAGYVATPIAMVQAALTVLNEPAALPKTWVIAPKISLEQTVLVA